MKKLALHLSMKLYNNKPNYFLYIKIVKNKLRFSKTIVPKAEVKTKLWCKKYQAWGLEKIYGT